MDGKGKEKRSRIPEEAEQSQPTPTYEIKAS